jgi:2-methylisocitrate lyase-like PEP mutase family enzyme
MSDRPASQLRELLKGPELISAPGVADALNARLVAQAGFQAIYMTGAGTSAVRLGVPDIGLLTMHEMVDNAGRIAEASGLPLIADADTGYGGPINVRRTIQAYERAGVAGVHIEDQQWPKRCGHLAGKTLIPTEEMSAKIKAAVDARVDHDFVVIARSDALAVEGFEAALERGKAYEEAGADIIFIEAPRDMEQLRQIPETFSVPSLYNLASSGKTPLLPASEIEDLGYKIVIYPNLAILAAIPAITEMLAELKETGSVTDIIKRVATFREFFDLLGMEEIQEMEERYAVSDDAKVGY